ncbi:hypothetical protein HF325_003308 [Metschnikowia pulcherrima]|uniref:Uncharacterized protein n=1 Tax=Metschnikowia pulcherrima TaxID=27326 RepID=A0A8H7GS72_9ASCO|nr:hypothetical protein HF325_003308 [Metschnikowia pulcherrima]
MFTCQTCEFTSPEIGKHLSQTRHKKVSYDDLLEQVECEECGDLNVHLLQMLRYGLSDLSLLCTNCSLKLKTEPTAEYTLSNGSLFLKLPQYYKFRDIHCKLCGSDRKLAVGNNGGSQLVLCNDCIGKENVPANNFVNEDSDDFLFALLGIKEYIAKPGKTKGSGRKLGRKGGRDLAPKKFDPDAERRKAHYENEKATRMSYKSEKTMKAVGSSSASPVISRGATPKPRDASKSEKGGKNGKKESLRGKGTSTLNLKSNNSLMPGKDNEPKDRSTKNNRDNAKTDPFNKSTKSTRDILPAKAGSNLLANGSENPLGINSMQKSFKKREKPAKNAAVTTNESQPNDGAKREPKKGKGADAKSTKDMVNSNSPATNIMKLPPGIFKHEPSPTPKLTYDSMEDYFNEMCYNLFLEEKMSIHTSQKVILTPGDFELEWYADQNKKHRQFKLNVLLTPEFLDRYLSKKMQNLKKNPFVAGQSLILMLGDDIPWYGNIVLVDSKSSNPKKGKPKRGRGHLNDSSPKLLEIIVELYKWNRMPLPITTDVRLLRVLPVSVPVSRVFTAMSRILNPRFIDMLLGKTPIRQIFFKNYLKFSRDSFNESQKVAVQSVMNNSITVLQGPPGTGKTSTIYEVILQLLDNLNTYPILVVAASNIAIDNIAEKLLPKHGHSILRIVSMEKEPEYNREHPLASICLHHKVYDGMPANLQESIKEMRRPNSKLSQSQYKKLLTTQIGYSDKIIALSRVIFTTTVVAGGNQLKPIPKMPVVIMDEATQSSEPTTLIPLSMNGVEKFVFVGDQKQLSSFSQVPNLSLSLFERILSNGTYKTPHMLDTQYRMHPAISKFPREKFYDGLLKDGLTPADRLMEGIPENPVVFWDTCGKSPEGTVFSRFREDSGLTYANKGEVDFIQKVLIHLIYEKNIKKSEIGVITPYRGQRDLISSTLVKNDLVNPEKDDVHVEVDREDFYNESKPVTIHTVSDIMVASIDAFQGREKDFLIMSCVRSNKLNKIGFLSDARRMNVALTRARYGLILIGDVECLKNSDGLWREYIESLEEAGSIKEDADFKFD